MSEQLSEAGPQIRLSLPSKGRLYEDSMDFLSACGLRVYRPNERQYEARIPAMPEVKVIFQRPGDIVVSVRDGSVDFGITGLDVIEERRGENAQLAVLHDQLGFGYCTLALAAPEQWQGVVDMPALVQQAAALGRPLRVATKYPVLTERFLSKYGIAHALVYAEGALETAPAIGYADMISDLVSSGQTKDNRLRPLLDGAIQPSQAALIANKETLKRDPRALAVARHLLEYFDAHLRASENLAIFANMRGDSPEAIAQKIFDQTTIGGLQGPTISRIVVRDQSQPWYAVNIIVKRSVLFQAINELRGIGGSGVVVMPVSYIFEEEPPRYKAMLDMLNERS